MKIGFIGCGNMGEAMLSGILKAEITSKQNIAIFEKNEDRKSIICSKYSLENKNETLKEVVNKSDYIVLAVKPNIYPLVLNEIKEMGKPDNKVFISIAAGVKISQMEDVLGNDKKIIRTMPNTPALVGMGMASVSPNKNVTKEELSEVKLMFESFGKVEEVDEKLIDTVTAVSGSSPAYVYMFIEAMADGAVLGGMPRDKAYKFAAQTVMGAAKMVLDTGEHPGKLKDNVCSPGGTTIEAVAELERGGLRSTVVNAMRKCMEKAENLSKK